MAHPDKRKAPLWCRHEAVFPPVFDDQRTSKRRSSGVDYLADPSTWATLALLIGLELVLGVDNVLMISLMTSRLAPEARPTAMRSGLALAFVLRITALLGVTALLALTKPVAFGLSWKDLVLGAGGLFLVYKAAREIHHSVEHPVDEAEKNLRRAAGFGAVIVQIAMLDLVFSIDSVITAVGLTPHLMVIIVAVVLSFVVVLFFARRVGDFIHSHPALKVLCLAFLMVIGVTLLLEAFHHHVPRGYLYAPLGFALLVELAQMRQAANAKKRRLARPAEADLG